MIADRHLSPHRHLSAQCHLSDDEICERGLEINNAELSGRPLGLEGCSECEAEVAAFAQVFAQIRRADVAHVADADSDWNHLMIRSRIREAISKEPLHSRPFFGRLAVFRPVFAAALAAVLALAIWIPGFQQSLQENKGTATAERLPAWSPLPDEADDEGLAVLAEWTPNEDELTVARCRGACQSGLSAHEENLLLTASANAAAHYPLTEASPL